MDSCTVMPLDRVLLPGALFLAKPIVRCGINDSTSEQGGRWEILYCTIEGKSILFSD